MSERLEIAAVTLTFSPVLYHCEYCEYLWKLLKIIPVVVETLY